MSTTNTANAVANAVLALAAADAAYGAAVDAHMRAARVRLDRVDGGGRRLVGVDLIYAMDADRVETPESEVEAELYRRLMATMAASHAASVALQKARAVASWE